jgi:hypothetical protein
MTHGLLIMFYSLSLLTNLTWSSMLGSDDFCWPFVYIGIFGIIHLISGNFFLAFIRILYMKHETWVKYVFGEMRLMSTFMIVNLAKSAFLTYFYVDGPTSQMTIYNFCIGHRNSSDEAIKLEEEISLTKILILHWGISLQTGELICYILFFVYVYQHNKHMGEINVLQDNQIRDRHRKNAITMIGQIYSSVLETIFIILLLLFLKTNLFEKGVKELFILAKINEFGLMSFVQVMLSPELRKEAKHFFKFHQN